MKLIKNIKRAVVLLTIYSSLTLSKLLGRKITHGELFRSIMRAIDGLGYYSLALLHVGKELKMSEVRKVLIIRLDHIGDVLLTTPLISSLKRNYSHLYVAILVGSWAEELVRGNPFLDEIIVLDVSWFRRGKRRFDLNSLKELVAKVKLIRAKGFDLVLEPRCDPLNILLAYAMDIPHRVSFDVSGVGFLLTKRVRYPEMIHTIHRNLKLLEVIGGKVSKAKPFLPITDGEEEFARLFLKKHRLLGHTLIGFHPGSHPIKRWPIEKFASLGERLAQDDFKVLVFGGKDEIDLARRLYGLMRVKPVLATGELSLKQTATLIKACKILVTNDSGLMHIATAVGTPTVALFGPSGYQRLKFEPYGKENMVLTKDSPCAYPCIPRILGEDCKTKECLDSITVEEVYEVIRSVLR
jgi:lipopolysaccharide heptosyltransferase II